MSAITINHSVEEFGFTAGSGFIRPSFDAVVNGNHKAYKNDWKEATTKAKEGKTMTVITSHLKDEFERLQKQGFSWEDISRITGCDMITVIGYFGTKEDIDAAERMSNARLYSEFGSRKQLTENQKIHKQMMKFQEKEVTK